MPQPDKKRLIQQATRIVMRLQEAPHDQNALQARDDFLALGDAQRDAYDTVLKAWKVTGARRAPLEQKSGKKTYVFALLGALVATLYFSLQPLQILALADFRTELTRESMTLASGDLVQMDGSSALIDRTDGADREVKLMSGAAFFDVAKDGRQFVVSFGEITVRVLGTSFETAYLGNDFSVSVREGSVEVVGDGRRWILSAGDRLNWVDETQVFVEQIDPSTVASWSSDRLSMDGMTLKQVAEIIERRVPGRILIVGEALGQSKVTGSLDLSTPDLSLRALVSPFDARTRSITPFLTVIY